MLSRVVIQNFKSIGDSGVDLALKPLTLLVGPNGGGKSSILEAIAVASQRHISGRLIQFPSWESTTPKQGGAIGYVYIDFAPVKQETSGGIKVTINGPLTLDFQSTAKNPTAQLTSSKFFALMQSNTFLVSAVRGDVPYAADPGGTPNWVGVHGQDLLLLLSLIRTQRRHKDIADRIAEWANRFGIADLYAGPRGANRTGADYVDSETKAVLDLALASTGARQILTVITQLFWSPEGSLLLIEEPEISLHPKGQIDVLEMFAEAIHEGNRQIIATTHSVFILQALGYAVLKGWLKPEDMAVYHVEKGKEGTTATLLPLDEKGYIQDWVPSFAQVERDLMREWAKSLPRE